MTPDGAGARRVARPAAAARATAVRAAAPRVTAVRAALVWAGAFVLALPLLRLPLDNDDQALFRVGSALLRAGGVLYRDLWDVKQPGIYAFYRWAETAFGTGAVAGGVHWALVLWLATTALLAATVAAIAMPGTRAVWLAPLLTTALCVLRADAANVAQLESLVPLPILGALACTMLAVDRRLPAGPACLGAGLCIGLTAAFKLLLAAIPFAVLLFGLARLAGAQGRRPALTAGGAALAAMLAAGLLVAWPYRAPGVFERFVWTQLAYPPEAIAVLAHAPAARLQQAFGGWLSAVVAFLPAALLGVRALRAPSSGTLARAGLLAWLAIGGAAILAQQLSWHPYHFVLLYWPVAMLAAFGLAAPRARPSGRAGSRIVIAIPIAIACVVLGLAWNAGHALQSLRAPHLPAIDSRRYLADLPVLAQAVARADCRSAIVFGSPALLLAAGLTPVGELTGQLAPILLPRQWQRLEQTLRERRPAFVYRADGAAAAIEAQAPTLHQWLATDYRPLVTDAQRGAWLVPRVSREPGTPGQDRCETVANHRTDGR